jgi:hypothetical protein
VTYLETLQESIDELEERRPFLNKEQQELLAYYYQLLKKEWEELHQGKVNYPKLKKDGPA